MHIRIATRNSKLALWQADYVAEKLRSDGHTTETVTFETKGDKVLNVSIAKIGSKGVFTEELEHALETGKADIAVHSAKDMPSELPDGMELIAFTPREKVNDVMISANEQISIQDDIIIGTSSTRRTALIKHYFPGLRTVSIRGNLQTRIRKMREGACDALMLAYAGVYRMGYQNMIIKYMDLEQFIPPVGQGSVTVEAHNSLDRKIMDAVKKAVNDYEAWVCLMAERAYLKTLQGGCSIPAFGYARLQQNMIHMTAGIVSLDGKELIRKTASEKPENASSLGDQLAREVLASGGTEILKEIKRTQ
jgi:hydroxymethylbilane synthase